MVTDEEGSAPRATDEGPARSFDFSVEEVAEILRAHVEREGLLPAGTYHLSLTVTRSGLRFECTLLPNVHMLPARILPTRK